MNKTERAAVLSRWIQPSSLSEQDRQDRAERMVRDAIDAHAPLADAKYRIYPKGSYANNTNIRLDSDVDIVVECYDCFYYEYGPGAVPPAARPTPYSGPWAPSRWRAEIAAALCNQFGASGVDSNGSVAIVVSEVPGSRPSTDVVPSFEFRSYRSTDLKSFREGSAVITTSGTRITNWPQQQLDNGRKKNDATGRRYKNFVRALKNAENALAEDGLIQQKPSYLMECLVWNVPNDTLCAGDLDAGFRATLVWLWGHLTENYVREEWVEPNELKYLFGDGQKWTVDDAKELVQRTWTLLGY